MCVRKRMGEKRMDGRMEMTETHTDQMKKIKRRRTYGKRRNVSSIVFSLSFSTKPCIPIISNLKTISAEKICYLALCSLKCSHIKQSGHQLHISSFHKMCLFLFWEVLFVSTTVILTPTLNILRIKCVVIGFWIFHRHTYSFIIRSVLSSLVKLLCPQKEVYRFYIDTYCPYHCTIFLWRTKIANWKTKYWYYTVLPSAKSFTMFTVVLLIEG
jgi:hypothetical protein